MCWADRRRCWAAAGLAVAAAAAERVDSSAEVVAAVVAAGMSADSRSPGFDGRSDCRAHLDPSRRRFRRQPSGCPACPCFGCNRKERPESLQSKNSLC